jgi:hypothetical protein
MARVPRLRPAEIAAREHASVAGGELLEAHAGERHVICRDSFEHDPRAAPVEPAALEVADNTPGRLVRDTGPNDARDGLQRLLVFGHVPPAHSVMARSAVWVT